MTYHEPRSRGALDINMLVRERERGQHVIGAGGRPRPSRPASITRMPLYWLSEGARKAVGSVASAIATAASTARSRTA